MKFRLGLLLAMVIMLPAVVSAVPWFCMDRFSSNDFHEYPEIEIVNMQSSLYCIDNEYRSPSPLLAGDALGFSGLTYMWISGPDSPLEEASLSRDAYYHSADPAGLAGYILTSGTRRAILRWQNDKRFDQPQFNPSISGYDIERKRNDQQSWSTIATNIQVLNYTDSTISSSYTYAYRIFSLDSEGRRLPYSWSCTPTVLASTDRRSWVESISCREDQLVSNPQTYSAVFHVENLTNGDVCSAYLYYHSPTDATELNRWHLVTGLTIDPANDRVTVPPQSLTLDQAKKAGFIGFALIVNNRVYPQDATFTNLTSVRQLYGCSYNNRVIAGGWSHYVMNPESTEWRTALTNHLSSRITQGFDGFWLDNAFPDLGSQDWFLTWIPWEYTTAADFQTDMIGLLQHIRTAIGTAEMYVNSAVMPFNGPSGLDAYYDHVDIDLVHEINNESGNKWLWVAAILQRAAQSAEVVVESLATRWGDPEARLNDLATYFNVLPDGGNEMYFGYAPRGSSEDDVIRLRYYAELLNYLGAPLTGSAHDYSVFATETASPGDCTPANALQYRRFEKGVVFQNIHTEVPGTAIDLDFEALGLPGTMWKVSTSAENQEAHTGANLTTSQVDDGYHLLATYPVFLLYDPIQYPEIADAAMEPLVADGATINSIRVQLTTPAIDVTSISIYDPDPSNNLISGKLGVVLYDDGVHGGDAVAGDDIFTGAFEAPLPWSVQAGTYSLDAWVNAASGLINFTEVDVTVETATLRYENKSVDTALQYTGQPRNATPVDFNSDGKTDLIITFTNNYAQAYRLDHYLAGGIPVFGDDSTYRFPSFTGPAAGTAGILAADYNNDGDIDFFAPNPNGARLYFNNGATYENHSANSNISTLAGNAVGGAWGDYDRDGLVDLFVQYGSNDSAVGHPGKLLRNNPQGGLFTAVSSVTTSLLSNSAIWADFDADAHLDLMLVGAGDGQAGGNTVYWINQGDGTFVNEAASRIPAIALQTYLKGHTSAAAGDMNSDGFIDVAFVGSLYYGYLENTGTGNFEIRAFAREQSGEIPLDISVIDFDLDGYQDIAFSGGTTTTQAYILANREGSGGQRVMVDVSDEVGLERDASFQGLATSDFDRDGVVDIYLGRAASSQEFFFKGTRAEGQPANHWIGVRVQSLYGANNYLGLGATVAIEGVTDPTVKQVQVIDGGSGRASQNDRVVVFGLGDYSGEVWVRACMPNGVQTGAPLAHYAVDQTITITDHSPAVDNDSVLGYMVYDLNDGSTDWEFYWETDYASQSYFDKVVFGTVSQRCGIGLAEVTWDTPNVIHEQLDLGNGRWSHKMTVPAHCEARCVIPFTVESSLNASEPSRSAVHNLNMPTCLQQ